MDWLRLSKGRNRELRRKKENMTKVIGNKDTARYWTSQYFDKKQMKKVQCRAQKRAWEMLRT